MKEGYGVCPVCSGTHRMPVPENSQQYKHVMSGYDKETDTLPCYNCGGQRMFGKPTGEVKLRADGTPCKHEYTGVSRGRCYTVYTCKHCGDSYDIDSGD